MLTTISGTDGLTARTPAGGGRWARQTLPSDGRRLGAALQQAVERSYVPANAEAIEVAAVDLAEVLVRQLPELHAAFALDRSLATDLHATDVVRLRQVAGRLLAGETRQWNAEPPECPA